MKRSSRPGQRPRHRRAPALHHAAGAIGAQNPSPYIPVATFLDLSNIWVGLRRAAEPRYEEYGLRLEFHQLRRLLAAGRPVIRALAVADAEVPINVQRALRSAGWEVLLRERGRLTGSEQANDETLQVRMYETINSKDPAVIVLATGDGAGSYQDRGFVSVLRAARAQGWGVEVAAWADSLNPDLKAFVRAEGGACILLDDYYFGISEVQLRGASMVSLRHRGTADATVLRAKPGRGWSPSDASAPTSGRDGVSGLASIGAVTTRTVSAHLGALRP